MSAQTTKSKFLSLLDSEAEDEVLNVLETLNRQGKTIILVTHSCEIATRAGNLVKVRDGQIETDREN